MLRKNELLEIREILLQMKKDILKTLAERIKSNDITSQREIGDIFDDADLEQPVSSTSSLGHASDSNWTRSIAPCPGWSTENMVSAKTVGRISLREGSRRCRSQRCA